MESDSLTHQLACLSSVDTVLHLLSDARFVVEADSQFVLGSWRQHRIVCNLW